MRAWVLVLMTGCGRIGFDPIGDPFVYGKPKTIYLYNDVAPAKTIPIEDNAPISAAGLADFTITPDLQANTGLTFDPLTGVMSGRPTRTSPPTVYTVTATAGDLVSSAQVTIRTAPGFYVTDLADHPDASANDDDCVGVTSTCTLRAALQQLAAFDTTPRVALVVPPGTMQLGFGELTAMRPLELIGTGRDTTAIDAAGMSRVLGSADLNTVIVSDLTLRRGTVTGDGGGCFHIHGGDVVLRDLIVEGCTGQDDGGVSLFDGSTLPMQATVERVVFRNNSAVGSNGALGASSGVGGTTITITACEFTGNSSPFVAALGVAGRLTVRESLFTDNSGSVAVFVAGASDVRFINDTIAGNRSVEGPSGLGTNNDATVHIINSTIVDNTCASLCYGQGGIGTNSGGQMTIRNTIVARNRDLENNALANCSGAGTITSLGNNLSEDPAVCFDQSVGDRFTADFQLLPLADYGGPTRTIAFGAGSPAYDGGSDAECPATDQRGYPRPARGSCDIGAFEAQ